MRKIIILLIAVYSFTLLSCFNLGGTLTMKFSDTKDTSRNSAPNESKTAAGDPYIGNFEVFNSAYEGIGNQVDFSGSLYLTPSSFILPFTQAALGNGSGDLSLAPNLEDYPEEQWNSISNIDFCDPETYSIYPGLFSATYNTMFLRITGSQRALYWNDTVIWETPVLTVTVPGYTDAEWPDLSQDSGDDGVIFMRKYLGDNTFFVDLSVVSPSFIDPDDNSIHSIENYMFCSDYSEAGIILPGMDGYPDYIDTDDFGYVSSSSSTNIGMLLFPFDEIDVRSETIITFTVETEDILTVYDNGTPLDKSDDKLMLVNDYWDHFQVTSENL